MSTDLCTVVYIGATDRQINQCGTDPRGLLTEGTEYEVEAICAHSGHTEVMLAAFPGKVFNSVCFEKGRR